MNRLIQGDVGSGKTIAAFLSMIAVAGAGYQSAMMAPTEILAKQHYNALLKLIDDNGLDYKCELLTGSLSAGAKRTAKENIRNAKAQFVIGTHAVITENVEFNCLGLVITDEQHRFGVRQRENLSAKGNNPHILVMSATPIPRSLAIILYGDLDISVIDEKPASRLPIKNCIVDSSYRDKVYRFIEKEIHKGHQAYVICAMAEENEDGENEIENVKDFSDEIRRHMPENFHIEYLHGKMKSGVKNEIMEKFSSGGIDILVSTTVIEVGIDVPNSTVMFVVNAERFGLAGLHQLRGRVGRGSGQSYCIFESNTRKKESKERLEILKSSNDGFYISEQDLKLRGPGDMLGTRQSGDMGFAIGNIYADAGVLKMASDTSKKVFDSDPKLSMDKNITLKHAVEQYMETRLYRINL